MDKESYILNKVIKKRVLDIGSGGDLVYVGPNINIENELCKRIKKIAKELTVVEIDTIAAKTLKKFGFNTINGNAEKIKLRKKFDVIVMGDVIEHVDNVGLLIENMKRHLTKNGRIIISSPNPFFIGHFLKVMMFKKPNVQYDHTSFITEQNLKEICRRHNLKIVDFQYLTNEDERNFKLLIKSKIGKSISKLWKYFNASWIATIEPR